MTADLAGTGPFVTLTNTASVGAETDGDPSNNTASITVNVPRPDTSLFMGIREADSNGAFGLNVTAARRDVLEIEWRVAISIPGIVPITVTDTLPAGLTFVGTTSVPNGSGCGAQGQVVTCQITSSSGAFWIFRFLVAVSTQLVVPDTLINTAEVSAYSDADPANNTASVAVNVTR